MAFQDIFEETRKKLSGYFGVGRPGLGTFGQQVKNTFKPVANLATRKLPSFNAFNTASNFARQQMPRFQGAVSNIANDFRAVPSNVQRNIVQPIRRIPTNFSYNMQHGGGTMTLKNGRSNSPLPMRIAQGAAHGIAKAGTDVFKIASRASQSPVVNTFVPGTRLMRNPQLRQINQNQISSADRFIERTAPQTTAGKVSSFVGENLPYLAIPMGKSANMGSAALKGLSRITPDVLKAAQLAKAAKAAKLSEVGINTAKNALIGSGFSASNAYGEGKGIKDIAKSAAGGAAAGAGLGLVTEGAVAGVGKISDLVRTNKAIKSIINVWPTEFHGRFVNALRRKTQEAVDLGTLKPNDFKKFNGILSGNNSKEATENILRLYPNVADKLSERMTPEKLADLAYSALYSSKNKIESGNYPTTVKFSTPKPNINKTNEVYLGEHQGGVSLKSVYPGRIKKSTLEGGGIEPSSGLIDVAPQNADISAAQSRLTGNTLSQKPLSVNPSPTEAGANGLGATVPQVVAQTGRTEVPPVVKATTELEQSKPILQSTGEQGGRITSQKPVSFDNNIPDEDLISQLTKSLKEAKPLRGQQEAIYTQERAKKFAKMMSARSKMAGEKGLQYELGALKGEMPKVEYETIRNQFNQNSIDRLFNIVKESKKLDEWDKINAQVGLSKLLGEQGMGVPTRSEIEKLYNIFGKDFTEALLSKRPLIAKLQEAGMQLYNLPRSMMAGFGDFSATLMQNALFAYRHPVTTGKNFIQSLKYFGSDNFYKASMEEIASRPNADLYKQAKLSMTDVSPLMSKREEEFMASWAEKIPGIGRVIKASGRAYTGFLNKMRADVADQLINTKKLLGENHKDPKFLQDMGTFVNMSTGRGNLGQLERSANVLAQGLFSARKLVATFQTLNPVFYIKADPLIRKEALKTMGAFFGGATTITGLAKLAGAEVSTDPTSSDFGKIKIGNTRINMFGTYQQLAVLTARMIKGYATSSTTGKKMTLGDESNPYSPTRLDLMFRFFESKEHPTLSLITGAMKGQNQIGEDFDLSTETLRRFMPMLISDSYDLYKEHGAEGLLGVIPAMLGLPTQTYGSQVPNLETTKSGKPTIKLKSTPDISESMMLKLRGQKESNIPKEQWQPILDQKKKETQTDILKEQFKTQGQKGQIPSGVSGGVTPMPDGSFGAIIGGELKTFPSEQKAKVEQGKYDFEQTDKKSGIVNGVYYFRKDDDTIGHYTEAELNFKVRDQQMEKAKENNNYGAWAKLAQEKQKDLEQQWKDADGDPLAQLEIENKLIDHYQNMAKYASYGGFKKGKKGKKIKFSAFDSSTTSGIKIPISKATKPNFKKITSTPKIPVSTKARGITKSYLANLR